MVVANPWPVTVYCMHLHTEPSKKIIALVVLTTFLVGIVGGMIGSELRSQIRYRGLNNGYGGAASYTGKTDDEVAFISLVEQINPAVVSIQIQKRISADQQRARQFSLEDLFGPNAPFFIQPELETSTGTSTLQLVGGGSGFIIESDGLIVTNRHVVVDDKAVYRVVLANGQSHEATVLARDPVLDVALLKIEATGLPTLVLGNSDTIKIGQSAVAIGNALAEFGNTVTRGVISGIGRRVQAGTGMGTSEVLEEAIQTDAAINPGNSGGPLLNLSGEVIGINTAVSREGQLIGFAIPINQVKRTIESVRQHGRIIRPWMGVRYVPVTPRLAAEQKLSVTHGVLIGKGAGPDQPAVAPGSPAEKAGLGEGDIILQIDGKNIDEKDTLAKEIAKHQVGDTITLTVLRDGKDMQKQVRLEEFPVSTIK